MGREPEQTFFQRHTNGQEVQEKVLNITNHWGYAKANQNHNEIAPHTCENDCHQKEITNVGKDVKKTVRTLVHL